MTLRIAPSPRTITWTESSTVAIGFNDCVGCGIETPEPPDSALIEYAKAGGERTLWPADSSTEGYWQWMPSGWSRELVTKAGGGPDLLCPDCTRAAREAIDFALRRKPGVSTLKEPK